MPGPQKSASVYECGWIHLAEYRQSAEVFVTSFMAPNCTRCRLYAQVDCRSEMHAMAFLDPAAFFRTDLLNGAQLIVNEY